MEVDFISKKKGRKQNLIKFSDFSADKMIFALLTKVITLHVRLIIIDVR